MLKKKLIGSAICASVLVGAMILNASALNSMMISNKFSTNAVNISLSEYQIDDQGNETAFPERLSVLPGTHINQVPRISNNGADCYVRAKVEYDKPEVIDTLNVNKDWVLYDDGYYYNKNILKEKNTSDIYNGIVIANNLDNSYENIDVNVSIQADAIQSANFEPNWESSSPWGNVEVLKYEDSGTYKTSAVSLAEPFNITYDGNSKKLITNSDDFFSKAGMLMPGDVYSDTISIYNRSNETIILYFKQIANNDDILSKVALNIKSNDNIIYDSNKIETTDTIELISLKSGETSALNFSLSIPADLNNNYALKSGMVNWYFSTDAIIDPTEPSSPSVPTEPSDPIIPTEPSDPSVPTEPSDPSAPTEPSDPSAPTEPSSPSAPTEPSSPSAPTEPSSPSEQPSNPSVPTEPSSSKEPIKPTDNSTHTLIENPTIKTPIITNNSKPNTPDTNIITTGENNVLVITMTILMAICATVIIILTFKKNK